MSSLPPKQFMPMRRNSILSNNTNSDRVSLTMGHANPSPPQYNYYSDYFQKQKKITLGKGVVIGLAMFLLIGFAILTIVLSTN